MKCFFIRSLCFLVLFIFVFRSILVLFVYGILHVFRTAAQYIKKHLIMFMKKEKKNKTRVMCWIKTDAATAILKMLRIVIKNIFIKKPTFIHSLQYETNKEFWFHMTCWFNPRLGIVSNFNKWKFCQKIKLNIHYCIQ